MSEALIMLQLSVTFSNNHSVSLCHLYELPKGKALEALLEGLVYQGTDRWAAPTRPTSVIYCIWPMEALAVVPTQAMHEVQQTHNLKYL